MFDQSPGARKLVEVRGLKMYFPIHSGVMRRHSGDVKAVDDVSFDIYEGETLGLVGESGCGKSTCGRAILRLYDFNEGSVRIDGTEIGYREIRPLEADQAIVRMAGWFRLGWLASTILHWLGRGMMPERKLRALRPAMQMVFQDPQASLNPRMTLEGIIGEPLVEHTAMSRAERRARVHELMDAVGLNRAFADRYPHEFSGGQRQRIGIARALALNPKFIVCDEPIAALDVSIQAQVVNLLEDLQKEFGLTYLFISHDLSMVRHIADRVAVMYLGKVVELAPEAALYAEPLHPYTKALLSAVPEPDPDQSTEERVILEGDVPSPSNPPEGCNFSTRCPVVMDVCRRRDPQFREVRPGRFVACHHYAGNGAMAGREDRQRQEPNETAGETGG